MTEVIELKHQTNTLIIPNYPFSLTNLNGSKNCNHSGAELESELESRQQQSQESLRGVHEQVIKFVDNMVQNYIGNVRRVVQRMTNLINSNRSSGNTNGQPRRSPLNIEAESNFESTRGSVLLKARSLTRQMHDFSIQWAQVVGKQQSPLLDRIPPRGVELWRDFWDTVRKQVKRINEEFIQLSRDMTRLVSRRPNINPSISSNQIVPNMYTDYKEGLEHIINYVSYRMDPENHLEVEKLREIINQPNKNDQSLIEESDDDSTKEELKKNVALRQQIQQEINVFGSIFDIMRTFLQRLRESATDTVREILNPIQGGSINNNNDAVTPGSAIKPQVDKLLEETVESQRHINAQAKPRGDRI